MDLSSDLPWEGAKKAASDRSVHLPSEQSHLPRAALLVTTMRDACGFCAPFDMSENAEILAAPSADGSKIAIVETTTKESLNELETILETDPKDEAASPKAEERVEEEEETTIPNFPRTPKSIVNEAEARDEPDGGDKDDSVETPTASTGPDADDEGKIVATEEKVKDKRSHKQAAPVTNPPTDKDLHLELDFDSSPTELYLLLQRRDWDGSILRAHEFPEETTHWVSRKEMDGKLRWRLLPIHGAIIFGAPDHVLKALLAVYPGSVHAKDDQGMLPLHLSYRMGSSEAVVEALLTAFPGSVEVHDAKGRTPLVMAQTTKSPNRAAFIKALERHAQATTISSEQHNIAVASQRAAYETQIAELRLQHEGELNDLKSEHYRLLKEMDRLKMALSESKGECEMTKARVEQLERRLESKSVGETSVANKVTAMESCLKATVKAKDDIEERLTRENESLRTENDEFRLKCSTLEHEISKLQAALGEEAKKFESEITRLEIKLTGKTEKLKNLNEDHASAKSYVLILEEQLKKKIAHENCLVDQVSSLARQLTVATQDNDSATANYTMRLRTIEKEREALRQTVTKLSRKLLMVAEYLEGVATEQATIMARVEEHEIDVTSAHDEHQKIAESVRTQQELFEQCRLERERISQMLRWEHAALQQSAEARANVLSAVEKHAKQVENASKNKGDIVRQATAMREQLQAILDSVNNYIPASADHDDANFVDAVLKTVLSAPDSIDDDIKITKHAVSDSKSDLSDETTEGADEAVPVTEPTVEEEPSPAGEETYALNEPLVPEEEPWTEEDEAVPSDITDEGVESSPSDEPAALSVKSKSFSFYPPVELDVNENQGEEVEATMMVGNE